MKQKRKQNPRQAHSISAAIAPDGNFVVHMHDADDSIFAFGNLSPAAARVLCGYIIDHLEEMSVDAFASCEGTA